MNTEPYEPLVHTITEHAGSTLRTIFLYDDAEWTALYVRDDVATGELEENVETLIQRARDQEPVIQEEQYSRLKEAQATVELHREGVLLHLREDSSGGVLVSLDREAARSLAGFIDRCNEILGEK